MSVCVFVCVYFQIKKVDANRKQYSICFQSSNAWMELRLNIIMYASNNNNNNKNSL